MRQGWLLACCLSLLPVPPTLSPASRDFSQAVTKSSWDINTLSGRQMWERQKMYCCSEQPGKHQATTTQRIGSLPAAMLFQTLSCRGVAVTRGHLGHVEAQLSSVQHCPAPAALHLQIKAASVQRACTPRPSFLGMLSSKLL